VLPSPACEREKIENRVHIMIYLLTILAHNEEKTIASVIREFIEEANKLNMRMVVHVIDDNSNDNTYQFAIKSGAKVYSSDGYGLVSAFRKGTEVALKTDADYFITVDADGQHSADDMINLISKVQEGYDLILGNRLHIKPMGMSSIHFYGNIILSKIISLLVNCFISDSQTGYRIFNRKVAEHCKCNTSKFNYAQEFVITASFKNYRIGEVPIYSKERQFGSSRLTKNLLKYLFHVSRVLLKLTFEYKLYQHKSIDKFYQYLFSIGHPSL